MSTLRVPVAVVGAVRPHPNADRLEKAEIEGWQSVVANGTLREGDLVVYVPLDGIVPDELAERWGVAQYFQKGRVRAARLRGVPSDDFVVALDAALRAVVGPVNVGHNVAEALGITKYEPPRKFSSSDALPDDILKVIRAMLGAGPKSVVGVIARPPDTYHQTAATLERLGTWIESAPEEPRVQLLWADGLAAGARAEILPRVQFPRRPDL